ncbi:MAG: putative lipid II flippase FtsW [Rhodospirillaceae bacterium]|nr:putative lipid II flippase FtsW [Rhodospirillaceae bacterium]|tara:strand:- start:238 stop:1362 length:1125 start_codon:yes stop_codon:yes gene_type:complete
MTAFTRTDTSLLGRWWWTIDHWTLAAVALLIGFGIIMTMAASPPVADRLGFDSFYFVQRQLIYLPIAIAALIGVSLMSPRGIRRFAVGLFVLSLLLLIATFFFGTEIKGARRWINISGLSLQPSEFIKPAFAVVTAWLFAIRGENGKETGKVAAIVLYGLVASLLLLQPDFGMTVVVSAVWFTQFFLAGLPLIWVAGFIALGIGGGVAAYFLLPHVASRVDRFIDPSSGDSYQVMRSMEAFMNGGVLGRGPGEGSVKSVLPDAHTDFVFAVAAEEFGLIACLIMVGLFAFVVLRGFSRVIKETNFFILLAVTGLLVQFGLQALVNMASTLHLMPTKGMTLPFISYGGSSLVSIALCIGMVLSLTRRRIGQEAGL